MSSGISIENWTKIIEYAKQWSMPDRKGGYPVSGSTHQPDESKIKRKIFPGTNITVPPVDARY
jgi:hypothetical protein